MNNNSHQTQRLEHKFVEFIPEHLDENTVYISTTYATAAHLCVCGCHQKVVTPLSPTSWQLIFDGDTVTLYPSIGNWSFACQSHYWITRNQIEWAEKWTKERIEANRKFDERRRQHYAETGELLATSELGLTTGSSLLWRLRGWTK